MGDLKDIKLGPQMRTALFNRTSVNKDARTVELSFSSEAAEVPRWYGIEVLGHGPNECDLTFLASGRAPLLVDHDRREQIGVVESARIADRTGRAVVRFGKSARAEQEFQDVMDGIRTNISCGYEVKELQLVVAGAEQSTYRATRWRPFEISLLALPADENVGIGRERDEKDGSSVVVIPPKEKTMSNPSPNPAPADEERRRATEMLAIGARHNMRDLAERHIAEGTPLEGFRGIMLDEMEKRGGATPLQSSPTFLDLSVRDTRRFSIIKAFMGPAYRARGDANRIDDSFERECSDAIAKKIGRPARGVYIPMDVQHAGSDLPPHELHRALQQYNQMQQRDLLVGTPTAGGNLVATNLLAASFIEALRNRMMVQAMGATMLSGLVGSVAIPKQTGAATAAWVAENAAPAESQQTIGQVTLSPKTVAGFTDYSRLLALQSTPAIEQVVRNDLSMVVAVAIDFAALHGTGAGNQPTGLALQGGVGSVAGGANGAAPTWDNIVDLEAAVANSNADFGRRGYLTNSKVRAKLKKTQRFAGTNGEPIWGIESAARDGMGILNGNPAGVSNNVRSDLVKGSSGAVCSAIFYGNWADLLIGEWGVLDILVNPYIGADAGTVRVHVFQTVDVAVRNAVSFAAMLDALTT